MRFDFSAKGGQRRIQAIEDQALARLTRALLRRKGGGRELLGFRDGTAWRDVRSEDINGYLKDLAREDISAKDFRTWHATVLTAALLASQEDGLTSVTSRKRVVSSVVKEVAEVLGNTPAVCRASYIDPRVIDRFLNGETIALPRRGDLTDDRFGRRWNRGCSTSWNPSLLAVAVRHEVDVQVLSAMFRHLPVWSGRLSGYGTDMQTTR